MPAMRISPQLPARVVRAFVIFRLCAAFLAHPPFADRAQLISDELISDE